MANERQSDVASIMEYVKSATLKGSTQIAETWFLWNLGEISLHFILDERETTVEYFRHDDQKNAIGQIQKENSEVIGLIEEINSEDKMVLITRSLLNFCNTFAVVDKAAEKKKSSFFVRRYYSC
ncbi:MAG: hypothetical protein J6D37_08495 [Clostridia bacterium]|nr:hypothetical protein [Clostridia bacterium]